MAATDVIISALPTGVPKGTDLTPATDTTDPTSSPTGTTKKYVRSDELNFYLQAQGLTTYQAVTAATTTSLTATYNNGTAGVGATLTNSSTQLAIVIDGVTLDLNARVLVKNQGATADNGIYYVSAVGNSSSNWVLTRSLDYDTPAEIIQYAVVLSNQGIANAGLLWQETGAGPWTIGTTPIVFAQYNAGTTGAILPLSEGGTSAALTASNGGIFYSTASAGAILAGTATAYQALLSGSSTSPTWSTAIYPPTTIANQLLYSSSANLITGLATSAYATLITSSGGVPSLSQTLPSAVQSNITALGTIAAGVWNGSVITGTYGGTGVNNGASTFTIGGNTAFSGAYSFTGTLTGATSVTFPTSGTLATTQQSFSWNHTTPSASISAAVNNGYVIDTAAQTTVTLPATAAFGSEIRVQGVGAGGWIVQANTGQTIYVGSVASSVAGSVTSANQYDTIQLVCIIANTTWSAEGVLSSGLTVV